MEAYRVDAEACEVGGEAIGLVVVGRGASEDDVDAEEADTPPDWRMDADPIMEDSE